MEVHVVSSSDEITGRNGSAVLTVAKALVDEARKNGRDATILAAVGKTVEPGRAVEDAFADEGRRGAKLRDAFRVTVGLHPLGTFRLRRAVAGDVNLVFAHNRPWDASVLRESFPGSMIILYVHNKVLTRLPKACVRAALAEFDAVVCVSEFIRRDLVARSGQGDAAPANWCVAVSGVSVPANLPITKHKDIDVLYVGRVVPEKGVGVLLDALALVPGNKTAMIVGGTGFIPGRGLSRFERTMRRRASKLSHTVHFTGPLSPEEVWRARSRAVVTVVPSVWPEPLGLTVLEAQASGSATIASNTGGIPEVAPQAAVITVPPGDVSALASALQEVLGDPVLAASLGNEGRANARTATWAQTYQSVIDATP